MDKVISSCLEGLEQNAKVYPQRETDFIGDSCVDKMDANEHLSSKVDKSKSKPFELYKRRTTVVVRRKAFLHVVCEALADYKYVGPNQKADLVLACRYS